MCLCAAAPGWPAQEHGGLRTAHRARNLAVEDGECLKGVASRRPFYLRATHGKYADTAVAHNVREAAR